ncbi:MAG: DUF3551 domain-containing protein [Pseudolabrys sp.]|nr:DUF3551 domain-containing protein [Pseudolabrys sp.]
MAKQITGLLTAATLTALLAFSGTARAEVIYPWCAQLAGDDGDNGVNCGFVTLAQCRATISGIGGECYENLAYEPTSRRPRKSNKPRQPR